MSFGKGCCCGMIFGFVFILMIVVGGIYAIYLMNNPEERHRVEEKIDGWWGSAKNCGDVLLEKGKNEAEKVGDATQEARDKVVDKVNKKVVEEVEKKVQPTVEPAL